MSETCETVKVEDQKAPGGFVIINKSDLMPEHVIFVEKKKSTGTNQKKESDQKPE